MAALSANAQQIGGDFNAEWVTCTPWDSKGNTTPKGSQPEGWTISNVVAAANTVGQKITRAESDYAVELKNVSMVGQKIPGYITLGTPWATAETKGTSVRNADGGAFGGRQFTFHPDAITFDYQRDNSNDAEEQATVVAYLWRGTWTQKDVPGNTAVGLFSYGNATKVDMTNRDRNVLGMEHSLGGDVSHTDGAALVASLEYAITESTGVDEETGENVWKTVTVPFAYTEEGLKNGAAVENINVIFSATNYFGDRNNIVVGNSFTIDNVKLVYYNDLTGLTTTDPDGNAISLNEEFQADKHDYTVDCTYDDFTDVTASKHGVGSTVDTDYDDTTGILTITVKGEDYDATTNPDAMTVYTIKYKKAPATLTSLVVSGHEFIKAGDTATEFTATGCIDPDDVSYETADDDVDIFEEFLEAKDGGKDTLRVTVRKENCPDNTYSIVFDGQKKDAVYQIPNADFEAWTTAAGTDVLGESWNSFNTAAGVLSRFAAMSPLPQKIEGVSGNGVRLTSADLFIAYANGNLTTGIINMGSTDPANSANYNFTDRTDVNGNLPFAGRPDAFEVYARFTPGTAKEEGVALHGRVQLLLHGEAAYHDPELSEQADSKIASAAVLIPATEEWTRFEGEFNYTGNEANGSQYLLASATTNPVPGGSKDDQLDLDNLKLIYYSTLKSLSYDGKAVEDFSPEKTSYTIQGSVIDAAEKLVWEKSGVGATVNADFDNVNGKVSITVLGNDYAVNSDNKTVYTITFEEPTAISEISAADAAKRQVYTLGGVRVSGKPAAGIYVVDGKKMAVK